MAETHRAELTDAAFPATLTIVRGTTGLAPTLAVRDPGTPNSYLDFADNTFKISGWATQFVAAAEVDSVESPGVYEQSLNINAWSGLTANSNHVKLEWAVLIGVVTRRPTDTLELVNHAYDVAAPADVATDSVVLGVAYDGASIEFAVRIQRNGSPVTAGVVGAALVMRDSAAADVLTVASTPPDVNGVVHVTGAVVLNADEPYTVEVTATDGVGTFADTHTVVLPSGA